MVDPGDLPERPAGEGLGADRSSPGQRSDYRPTRRPIYVDLDYLYGRDPIPNSTTGTASSPTPAVPRPPESSRETGEVAIGELPDGFDRVDGVATVRRPGRLICSGETIGVLHRWERAYDYGWIAIVSFLVPYTKDDPRPGQKMELVAVAAAAVRPRDPESPGPRPPARTSPTPQSVTRLMRRRAANGRAQFPEKDQSR